MCPCFFFPEMFLHKRERVKLSRCNGETGPHKDGSTGTHACTFYFPRPGPVCCQSHFLNNPTLPPPRPPPFSFSALRFPASAYQTHPALIRIPNPKPPPPHTHPPPPPPAFLPHPNYFPGLLPQRDSFTPMLSFVVRLLTNLPCAAGDGVHCVINTWRYSCCPECLFSLPSSGWMLLTGSLRAVEVFLHCMYRICNDGVRWELLKDAAAIRF